MRPALAVVGIASAAVLVAGCSTQKVVLLNNEGGAGAGAVVVLDPATGAEKGEVATADSEAEVSGRTVSARPVNSKKPWYGDLVSRVPYAPRKYVLYFYEGTTDITEESQPVLDALRQVIKADSEVQITGHTDTVGSSETNDRLSLERANEIRRVLLASGLPVEGAKVTGRGEREPMVATDDDVDEQANRRVEVVIRY
jgi:outer membrane protein OmpA-like peptidoglycan-associated protein